MTVAWAGRAFPRVIQLAAVVAGLAGSHAWSQAPTIPAAHGFEPGSSVSKLGPIPGAGGNPFGASPGTDPAYLGGRPGPSFPRVPSGVTTPGGMAGAAPGITTPARLTITDVPLYGPLEVPDTREEEGPPDGLTFDAAVDRLLRENLALASRRWQIPQARADVITAGLRANPVLYADAQLVPYGGYKKDRPGGPVQYDVNISHPVDYSLKRLARADAAARVVNVQEALYQDAVRVQVNNLARAYVDALAARETVRYARASVSGLGKVLEANEALFKKSDVTRPDVERVRALLVAAGLGVLQAEETLARDKRTLATLLNVPPDQAASIELRGTIADLAPPPPPVDELVGLALAARPDLAATRLGILRADAEVRLARANRFGDAYALFQPYTFQDNAPVGAKSATSWAFGATVPVPLYNRNQGGVARARLNADQSRGEAAAMEQRVVAEVRQAEREYAVSRSLARRFEDEALPPARQQRDASFRLFVSGELTAIESYNAEREYNETVRRYRAALIRHRRSMLALNTAVGRRVLP